MRRALEPFLDHISVCALDLPGANRQVGRHRILVLELAWAVGYIAVTLTHWRAHDGRGLWLLKWMQRLHDFRQQLRLQSLFLEVPPPIEAMLGAGLGGPRQVIAQVAKINQIVGPAKFTRIREQHLNIARHMRPTPIAVCETTRRAASPGANKGPSAPGAQSRAATSGCCSPPNTTPRAARRPFAPSASPIHPVVVLGVPDLRLNGLSSFEPASLLIGQPSARAGPIPQTGWTDRRSRSTRPQHRPGRTPVRPTLQCRTLVPPPKRRTSATNSTSRREPATQSDRILEALATFFRCWMSAATKASNSAGLMTNASAPSFRKKSLISFD
ncbi:hypothetical protein SAMN05216344_13514 [Polaromonas sp. OV174]|nr:hypothetical protein SAMN05216344_13514 [Polaromonas sp. OV174]